MRDKSSYFWSFHSLLLLFACLAITSCEDENTLTSLQLSEANVPLQGMSAGVPDVIMDITAQGFSTTGSWTTSNWQGGGLTKYGDNYLQDGNSGKGSKSATFTANVAPGNYNVYSWWCPSPSKATNTPVEVFTTSGKQTLTLDQRNQGGEWVLLGNYSFGSTAKVVIKNDNTNGYVLVDGLKLEATSLSSSTWLEAECSSVIGSNWNKVNSTSASGGTYITIKPGLNSSNTPPTGAADIASFKFNVNQTGSYYLFARIKALDTRSNSFWVRVDGGSWFSWNANPTNSAFDWRHVSSDSNPFTFTTTGNHTVDFSYREDGTLLDKLYLSSGSNAPTGMGEPANNCSKDSLYLPTGVRSIKFLKNFFLDGNTPDAEKGLSYMHSGLGRSDGVSVNDQDAIDGKAAKMFIEFAKPDPEKLHRMELLIADLPEPYFHKASENYTFAYFGQEYIYQFRLKLSESWEKTKNVSGQDVHTSIFEFKQDYFPGNGIKRPRDASFRLRISGDTYNLVVRATDDSFQEQQRNNTWTGRAKVESLSASGDFGKWRLWTVHAKWSSGTDGFIHVYRDNELVYTFKDAPTAFDDDIEWLAPYMKFGLYNPEWKNGRSSGSNYQEIFVDHVRVGVPK